MLNGLSLKITRLVIPFLTPLTLILISSHSEYSSRPPCDGVAITESYSLCDRSVN